MSTMDLQELMFETLAALVRLKEYKEEHGKDEYYLETMPELWTHAKTVLKLCESKMPTSENVLALDLLGVMPMFADDSNEGNIKRSKLIEDYKKQIPDWKGDYEQGFSDAFNWLCRIFKSNLA